MMKDTPFEPCYVELEKALELCDEQNINPDIRDAIYRARELLLDREKYCEEISSKPSASLNKIKDETLSHPFEDLYASGKIKNRLLPLMLSGSLEGNFLQSVVSMSNAKHVLEIGTFTGYAAMACAEALPADGQVVTIENEPYMVEMTVRLYADSPNKDKIQIREGDASKILLDLAKEGMQFDVVFIDANKDGYLNYFKTIMEHNMLAPGGSILFDNPLYFGTAYARHPNLALMNEGNHIKACNDYLKSRSDLHRVLLPVRDGILIVRRKSDVFY